MQYEYHELPVIVYLDGDYVETDIKMYIREYQKLGWDYLETLPVHGSGGDGKAEITLRFRRPIPLHGS